MLNGPGAMDFLPGEPCTVPGSNVGHRAVHVPKHTVVDLALPSPTHIVTLGTWASGGSAAKEAEGPN